MKYVIIGMVVCFSALVISKYRPITPARETERPRRVTFSNDAFRFGTVWESEHFKWTVLVGNSGVEPIDVISIGSSCNCLSVEPNSFHLEPGEKRDLTLDIDLTLKTESPEVRVSLFPRLKVKKRKDFETYDEPAWEVTGGARRVLEVNANFYLGRHSVLARPLPVWSLPVVTFVPLEAIYAKSDTSSVTASIGPFSADGKCTLNIAPNSLRRPEAVKGTITLKPVLKGGELLPERQIQFYYKIVPDVEAVPPLIQVGGRKLGEVFAETISLRSISGNSFKALRVEAEGEGLSLENTGAKDRWRVLQKVCRVGSQANHIRFTADSGGQIVNLNVDVSYTGLDGRDLPIR